MKQSRETIVFFIAATLFSVIFVLVSRWVHNANIWDVSTLLFSITNLVSILLVVFIFNKLVSGNANKPVVQLKKRLIPSLILFVIATFIITFSIYGIGFYLLFLIKGWNTAEFLSHLLYNQFPEAARYVFLGIFFSAIFFLYTIWNQAIKREQKLREENLKYKYINLKTQVNPHFLFNSLNTLSELVYVDANKADTYIQKLAGIYRYILDHEETELISLSEEVAFVEQFFDLQKERDGDKIELEITIKNAERFRIVPVSLQILVENALKHNAASKEKPVRIHINQDDTYDYIIVSNTLQPKNILSNSPGTGLSNLKERVKLTMGKEVIITGEENQFIVKLPVSKIER